MRPTTTTALALAGTALALPAGVALAESNDDPPSPTQSTLAAPFGGHLTMNAQMRAERREVLVERLTPRIIRTERKTARVKGVKFEHRAQKRRLRDDSPKKLRVELERSRRELRKAQRAAANAESGQAAAAGATPPHLEAIAACESGGNPSAVDPSGTYRGKYQFDMGTWASVGGSGDPAAASEAEQDARAAQLYAQSGSTPWPVCGR
jgi:soluble lytic murein transglycosylase-like protein